jgi:hypothetical protein
MSVIKQVAKYVNAKPKGSSSGSLKVYVPAIMTFPMGDPITKPFALNKALFINSKDCTPTVSTQVTTQNYITAQPPFAEFKGILYDFGTDIGIESDDIDYLTCKLSPEIMDKSYDPPPEG